MPVSFGIAAESPPDCAPSGVAKMANSITATACVTMTLCHELPFRACLIVGSHSQDVRLKCGNHNACNGTCQTRTEDAQDRQLMEVRAAHVVSACRPPVEVSRPRNAMKRRTSATA